MLVAWIFDGLGNQLFQYAFARKQSLKLGTKLKLDTSAFKKRVYRKFMLDQFRIEADIATDEEIAAAQITGTISERDAHLYETEIVVQDNHYIGGYWQSWRYFEDIEDVLRREIQPKDLSTRARQWEKEIESAPYSVSMHIRRGDYISDPLVTRSYGILSLQYYQDCLERLKQRIENFTVFVFSDDVNWVKSHIALSEKVQLVEGTNAVEDLFLISCCNAHIVSNSTFSWWGAWLDARKDKIVFVPHPWFRRPVQNTELIPPDWIKVPVKYDDNAVDLSIDRNFLTVIIPIYNQCSSIKRFMDNLLEQTFTGYQVYLIDDESTDGSYELCRKLYGELDFVHILRTPRHMGRIAAKNFGLAAAKGKYVMFAEMEDLILNNQALEGLHRSAMITDADILQVAGYLVLNLEAATDDSNIHLRQYNSYSKLEKDEILDFESGSGSKGRFLREGKISAFVGDKIYKREFLLRQSIIFPERNDLVAEAAFLAHAVALAATVVLLPIMYEGVIPQYFFFPGFAVGGYRRRLLQASSVTEMTECYVVGIVETLEKLTQAGCGEVDRGAAVQFMTQQLQQSIDAYNTMKHNISYGTLPEWMRYWMETQKE